MRNVKSLLSFSAAVILVSTVGISTERAIVNLRELHTLGNVYIVDVGGNYGIQPTPAHSRQCVMQEGGKLTYKKAIFLSPYLSIPGRILEPFEVSSFVYTAPAVPPLEDSILPPCETGFIQALPNTLMDILYTRFPKET